MKLCINHYISIIGTKMACEDVDDKDTKIKPVQTQMTLHKLIVMMSMIDLTTNNSKCYRFEGKPTYKCYVNEMLSVANRIIINFNLLSWK